jgi:hypothetical protein
MIAEAAATLHRRGWSPLADALLLLLPAASPLTWLAGQALWLAQPALAGWLDPSRMTEWALLLEEPDLGERLAAQLAGNGQPIGATSDHPEDPR